MVTKLTSNQLEPLLAFPHDKSRMLMRNCVTTHSSSYSFVLTRYDWTSGPWTFKAQSRAKPKPTGIRTRVTHFITKTSYLKIVTAVNRRVNFYFYWSFSIQLGAFWKIFSRCTYWTNFGGCFVLISNHVFYISYLLGISDQWDPWPGNRSK